MATLSVVPEKALADDPMQIKVTGLQPSQKVTIRLTLKDDRGHIFQSRAFFEANNVGEVNLDKTAALGGTYQGVHPMGLVWSLKPLKPFQSPVKKDVENCPFQYTVDLFDGLSLGLSPDPEPTLTKTCTRWHMAPGIQKNQIQEGRIRGTLFYPTDGKGSYPGIIDLYGGAGGLAEYRASLLASRGFVVLALAYFGYSDLPRSFQKLQLEYFEEAADLLLNHPKVSMPKVGVLGVSKGAEIALVLASFLPQIGATVSINGTCSVYGGTIYRDGEVLIKGTPYRQEKMVITAEGLLKVAGFYESPTSYIPVERAQGHILFVAGESDQYYNSKHFAESALSRMRKQGQSNGRMISYAGAGHLIEPPGFPFCWASHLRGHNIPIIWGGEMIPHCEAEKSIWKELQLFFLQHLNLSSNL
ncbi:acyl-coenzyme A amino acid N-acyltransferase 1-like [Hyla sarda]|uniref:acyl-coenzyme A amino acid N-acyltransferase 1-like n=1 Tax=Hyla sarda TaxID=327740 RepID=UPI0024C3336F|nr:acyl-coenzyme A amino acid N-acyltransferase 1-like [Hyla sarda]XP_056390449.1 acyl-coenzyme A amino acid N-acyltransferase 1-like [Hyla sarda]XP_056390450.1 acyl-coenzyme A amino acid N-acyltransferase 1-like [Hyla sarda]